MTGSGKPCILNGLSSSSSAQAPPSTSRALVLRTWCPSWATREAISRQEGVGQATDFRGNSFWLWDWALPELFLCLQIPPCLAHKGNGSRRKWKTVTHTRSPHPPPPAQDGSCFRLRQSAPSPSSDAQGAEAVLGGAWDT